MSSRKRTSLGVLAAALISAPASHAGELTVQKFDPATGALSPWAQGSLDYAPAHLLERGDPWLLDRCGQVYAFEEGTFGDMSLQGPLTPLHSLKNIKHIAVNNFSGVAITEDGKLVNVLLDLSKRQRLGEANFDWVEDPESTIPAGDTSILVHTRAGAGTYLFKTNGDLMKIDKFGANQDRGRYLGARGGWKDVTHAIVAEVLMGPNNLQQVLVTAHRDGGIKRHVIASAGNGNYSLESAALDGQFAGTAALLPATGFNQAHILRLTASGDLYRLDVSKGTEERLGDAAAFANGIVHVGKSAGYLVTASGDFSQACPEAPVVEEAVDPHADFDVDAVVEEFRAMNKLAEEFGMAINERVELTPPDELLGKPEAEIDAAMNAFLAELTAFEKNTLEPAIRKAEAHKEKYAPYGEFSALYELVREKSGYKQRIDNPVPGIEDDVQEYNDYKASLGNFVVGEARIQFQIAELQHDAKQMAKDYLEALPLARWALKLDPDNAEARGYVEKAAGLAGAAISAEKAAIAKAQWPSDVKNCDCDIEELKARAFAYFKREGRGEYADGSRVVAIRIRGSMKPGETNILEQILNWHVRGWIALTDPNEPWFLTVRPVEFDTETNDRSSRFSGYHTDGDEYQIPIERVEIDDEDALEESLRIIKETTGLAPEDMPEDALDPSVTGIPGADAGGSSGPGGNSGGNSGGAGGGPGSGNSGASSGNISASADTSVEKSIDTRRADAAAAPRAERPSAEGAGGAAGRVFGWILAIGAIGGAIWAGRKWRGRIKERMNELLPAEKRAAFNEKMRAAQSTLKEKTAKAAEKARDASAVATKKAREASESAAARAREAGEQARRKAADLRKH